MAMSAGKADIGTMSEINMTPMVDVMLVLLIIFMVITPALMAGFQAQLPDGANLMERPDEPERTTMGIDLAGNYYLNKEPMRKEDAPALLAQEFQVRHPDDKVLFVKADRRLRYGEIIDAMKLARDAGARVVAAVSEGGTQEKAEDAVAP